MSRKKIDWLQYYANPHNFMNLAQRVHLPLWGLAILALAYGLFLSFNAPADYQQGSSVRIMFIHVPAAWLSLFTYSFIAGASLIALIFRHPLGHVAARAAAPIGAIFTLATLITGSLWGQPIWGTWWVWDARLTSVLVLFFLYLGYMAIWRAIESPDQAAKMAAILALVGSVNVPIVKFSVDWWNTLHQPATFKITGKATMAMEMWLPLLIMIIGFYCFFATVLLLRMRLEVLRRESRASWVKTEIHRMLEKSH